MLLLLLSRSQKTLFSMQSIIIQVFCFNLFCLTKTFMYFDLASLHLKCDYDNSPYSLTTEPFGWVTVPAEVLIISLPLLELHDKILLIMSTSAQLMTTIIFALLVGIIYFQLDQGNLGFQNRFFQHKFTIHLFIMKLMNLSLLLPGLELFSLSQQMHIQTSLQWIYLSSRKTYFCMLTHL